MKKCPDITKDEISRILGFSKEKIQRKNRVNKIMFGRVDEVVKDTEGILRKILKEIN